MVLGVTREYLAEAQARIERRSLVVGTGCIECSLTVNRAGYSNIFFNGKMWKTHRLVWAIANGSIDENLTIDHLCYNRKCCNLDHLELVTKPENSRRGAVRHDVLGLAPPHRGWGHGKVRPRYCKRGHELTEKDMRANGLQDCRVCHSQRRKIAYHGDLSAARAASSERQRRSRAARSAKAKELSDAEERGA